MSDPENKLPINELSLGLMNLFRSDYNLSIHGRKAARILDQNQKTIQRCLNSLADSGILECKELGKNKLFTLNRSSLLAKHYLMLAERFAGINLLARSPGISELAALVCREKRISIIFGPCLTDTPGTMMDVLVVGQPIPDLLAKVDALPMKVRVLQIDNANFISQLRSKSGFANTLVANHIVLSGIEPFVEYLFAFYYSPAM